MKRLFVLFLVCLLLFSLTACAKQESDSVEYYLAEYTNEPAFEGATHQRILYTYDEQWRISSILTHFGEEEAANMRYAYSEDNTVVTSSDSVSGLVSEVHRTFDQNGNIIKMEQYDQGTQTVVVYSEYDDDNRITSQVSTYFGHALLQKSKTEYSYDHRGNEVTETQEMTYLDGNIFTSRTEQEYDSENRVIRLRQFTGDALAYEYLYTYDDSANTQTRIASGPANGSAKLIYTYDDLGNMLMVEAIGPDGNLQYRQRYRYVGTDGSEASGFEG